jgi:predicted transcriptional regulator
VTGKDLKGRIDQMEPSWFINEPKEIILMPSEILKLTTEIVTSHVSMTELTPEQLVDEIKAVYNVLASLEGGAIIEEPAEARAEVEGVQKPSVPLKDIVKAKYVVCLECGKKMRTLKAHLRKAHNLLPKEYYQRFELDPKKYPLVCREYSEQRSKMAKDRGFGVKGTHHKAS